MYLESIRRTECLRPFLNALGYSSNTRVLREQKSDAFDLRVDRSLSTHFLEKRFVL